MALAYGDRRFKHCATVKDDINCCENYIQRVNELKNFFCGKRSHL
jgi:hypothetical protein